MSTPTTTRHGAPEQLERELLRRLGLDASASPEDLDAAHEAVLEFLGQAPRQLRAWARAQAAGADEAYALLGDPAALARSAALVGAAGRPAPLPGGPATPPVRLDPPRTPSAAQPKPGRTDDGEEPDESMLSDDEYDALFAEVTPSAHRETVSGGKQAKRPAKGSRPAAASSQPSVQQGDSLVRRVATVAVGVTLGGLVLLAAGTAFGFVHVGSAGGPLAAASATPVPSGQLDEAAVAALMQQYQANPKDFSTLMSLGNAFYSAADYANAASWFKQAAAVDPTSIDAQLALGAASFNSNDMTTAEASWKKAESIDPKNVEAHYDLGYLYFSKSPQDVAGVQREWNEVIALDPTSATATQVKAHLATLGSPAASGSVSPSGSPAAGGSTTPASAEPAASSAPSSTTPAASPAPSPSAAGSGQ